MIIALAGHVDHGKTSLIRALTGIETDRLPDEKQRGMTIDLGFAHAALLDGDMLGFVDVPGHERFLTNMLAGVLGVDSVLLVIAADDGPMPQTIEHLTILRLTGITDLTAVISKTDRVDSARLGTVTGQVRILLDRAGFTDAAILPVSSHTGDGIAALHGALNRRAAARRARSDAGGFRMAIDRVFVVAGTGVVVTGTIAAGRVRLGDRLIVAPTHLSARVRGIQRHHDAAETAGAGDRCALALAGGQIARDRIRRGDWVIAPQLDAATRRLDTQLRASPERALTHGSRVQVHAGAAALLGRALVLGGADLAPDSTGFVSLALERPTALLAGDRVVLRDTASGRVVAGGAVLDPFPPERRVRREQRLSTLVALAKPDPRAALADLLAAEGCVDLARFAVARNLGTTDLPTLTEGLAARRIGRPAHPVLVSTATQQAIARWLQDRLTQWHAQHPELPGPTQATLLARATIAAPDVVEAVLLDQLANGVIERRDAILCLPGHRPRLSDADQAAWEQVAPLLDRAGTRPPRVRELAVDLGLDPEAAAALMTRLERFGLLLRVAPNRFFLPRTIAELGRLAEALAAESDDGGFNAATFNQKSGIGRNLTIQVVEFLDLLGITRRVGEQRHIVRPVTEVLG